MTLSLEIKSIIMTIKMKPTKQTSPVCCCLLYAVQDGSSVIMSTTAFVQYFPWSFSFFNCPQGNSVKSILR